MNSLATELPLITLSIFGEQLWMILLFLFPYAASVLSRCILITLVYFLIGNFVIANKLMRMLTFSD